MNEYDDETKRRLDEELVHMLQGSPDGEAENRAADAVADYIRGEIRWGTYVEAWLTAFFKAQRGEPYEVPTYEPLKAGEPTT